MFSSFRIWTLHRTLLGWQKQGRLRLHEMIIVRGQIDTKIKLRNPGLISNGNMPVFG
jgi:hypothetical protein